MINITCITSAYTPAAIRTAGDGANDKERRFTRHGYINTSTKTILRIVTIIICTIVFNVRVGSDYGEYVIFKTMGETINVFLDIDVRFFV